MDDLRHKGPFGGPSASCQEFRLSQPKRIRRGGLVYNLLLIIGLAACSPRANGTADGSRLTDSRAAEEPAERTEIETKSPESKYDQLEMVTLLPRDAIPAIDDPQFLTASEANRFYDPDELVIGVTFNGVTRAYSVPFLSNHEIVNDTVGGVKIAVTW